MNEALKTAVNHDTMTGVTIADFLLSLSDYELDQFERQLIGIVKFIRTKRGKHQIIVPNDKRAR